MKTTEDRSSSFVSSFYFNFLLALPSNPTQHFALSLFLSPVLTGKTNNDFCGEPSSPSLTIDPHNAMKG
ncbi:hypothetical protein L2E82_14937 [Cichorium intybus]|uniref:Uncharacterized protein n=1 Tax=Cichorium intybus TaxID=13427 RepID=A0ACB9F1U3_CICIN|nr:hypothetical protein L2E82_14937 [Cichorium intybus]